MNRKDNYYDYCYKYSQYTTKNYDDAFAIVRHLKPHIKHLRQENSLAPSKQIYHEYLRLRKEGQWNQDAFDNWYTKAFLEQLSHDNIAQTILHCLLQLDKQKKNIVLGCFCSDVNMCHRTIIASILAENGADVRADGVLKRYGIMYCLYCLFRGKDSYKIA